MKIKLLGTLVLSSALLLTACGQEEEKKEKDNKTETTKKENQKKTEVKKENKEDKSKEEYVNNEQQVNQQQANQAPQQEQPQQEYQQTQQPVQSYENNQTDTVPETSKAYGMNPNYPQENKANNPTGYLSEEDAQAMADKASEYDAEVAKHNANVEAHNDWINGQLESAGLNE
ncbi:hypothetical protein [Staphylococcus simulans]|uniref:hypothetical protein n=1 Tax=Staphylococcus simulans TaxID=1286 RepID=UPI000D1D47EB|nr:hypothetical protein [Staphylococcus simulans]PTJ25002.1 hypothetical protein BU039_00050 [Staphylococcus simulans]